MGDDGTIPADVMEQLENLTIEQIRVCLNDT